MRCLSLLAPVVTVMHAASCGPIGNVGNLGGDRGKADAGGTAGAGGDRGSPDAGGSAGTGDTPGGDPYLGGAEIIACPESMFHAGHPWAFTAAGANADANVICGRLSVGAGRRYFVLELPAGYDADRTRAYPLVFVWHGCGGTGGIARYAFQVVQRAQEDLIAVYPHSRFEDDSGELTDKPRCWSHYPSSFAFFDALHTALASLNVDRSRVFSAGYSSGAYMSHQLACYRSGDIAGITAISGGSPRCSAAVSAAIAHGEHDQTVSFSNFNQAVNRYVARNGCGEAQSVTPSPAAGPFVSCQSYPCDPGTPLLACRSGGCGAISDPAERSACQQASGHNLGTWGSWFVQWAGVTIHGW